MVDGLTPAEATKAQQRKRQVAGEAQLGILGHHTDESLVDVPGRQGYVYVRFPAGNDGNGFVKYAPALEVRAGIGAAFLKRPRGQVWVGRDYTNQLAIKAGDWQEMVDIGVNPSYTNPLAPEAQRTSTPDNFVPLLSLPPGTADTPGTKVTVSQWFYYDDVTFRAYNGTARDANKIDLAPFIPAAGYHRYAMLWIDTYTKGIYVTTSTAESLFNDMTITLAETHWQECAELRPADGVPIKAYYLKDDDPYVVEYFKHVDLRQMINVNRPHGFPKTIAGNERIQPDRQVVMHGTVTMNDGAQLIMEDNGQLVTV